MGIIGSVYNTLSWQGTQGFNAAAATPHDQKMGKVLSVWRTGFSALMVILLAVAAWTFMNHPDFASGAADVERELNATIHLDTEAETNQIQEQMQVPIAVRHFLPVGVTGVFCGVMIFLLISTDTSTCTPGGASWCRTSCCPCGRNRLRPGSRCGCCG